MHPRRHPRLRPEVHLLRQPVDPDGRQLPGPDELGDARLRLRGGEVEVLAQLPLRGDAVRAGRDPDQLALGVILARGRRGQHARREDALGEVVAPREVAPRRRRHGARAEEPLERDLRVLPVPHPAAFGLRSAPWLAVWAGLPGGDRAALGDHRQHRLDQARPLLGQAGHALDHGPRRPDGRVQGRPPVRRRPGGGRPAVPDPAGRGLHPPSQQRVRPQRQQRRLVPPVLEQLAPAAPQAIRSSRGRG